MVLKKINNKDMFSFKIIVSKDYETDIIFLSKLGFDFKNNPNKIENIYYDTTENKVIYIEFENDNVLKQYRIIGLDLF